MLSFDIRSLESKAEPIAGELAADDPIWQEGDPRPAGPVRVTGRVSAAGGDRFFASGHLEGAIEGECRRCLTEVRAPVSDEFHFLFVESGDEAVEDDPDVFRLDPRSAELDLRPALREQWLLSAPTFVLCREDCKGLCPRCGADLNAGACECPPATDPRWASLRDLRNDAK